MCGYFSIGSPQEGLLEKPKLVKHAYDGSHKVIWDEARIWKLNTTVGIYEIEGSDLMACLTYLTRQPSWDISPV
jgi:hypothetical protein